MMRTICQIDGAGYYIRHLTIASGEGAPTGWVFSDPPENPEANNLWVPGPNMWEVTETRPAPPVAETRLVSKSLWLANALYFPEKREFARLGILAGELSGEDFDSTDPNTLKITYWAAFLVDFNGLGEFIDLADQKVIEGVFLFCDLASISTERGLEILDWE